MCEMLDSSSHSVDDLLTPVALALRHIVNVAPSLDPQADIIYVLRRRRQGRGQPPEPRELSGD